MDYYLTVSAQETKETNKINKLTISCEKSCLIRREEKDKKVKNKWINNNKEINLDLNKKLVRFITHLKNASTTDKQLKKHTQNKTMEYITSGMGYLLSHEWIDGRYWSPLWYVMLTKVMNST